MDTSVLVGVLIFAVLCLLSYRRDRGYKLPPGPRPMPIIGSLYAVAGVSKKKIAAAAKSWGDVWLFYAGPVRIVVLNSYECIREALVQNAAVCSDRGSHMSYTVRLLNPQWKGIINADYSAALRHNRSRSLTILRNLGVGRATMEQKIQEEAVVLLATVAKQQGQAFDPWHIFACAVTNVLLSIFLNKRHKHDDEEFLKVVKFTDEVISAAPHMFFIDSVPFLRHFTPFRATFNKLKDGNKGMLEYMWKYAEKHSELFTPGCEGNFIDCWLDNHLDKESDEVKIDKEDFMFILRDFLIAGSETTTTSLKWTIIQCVNHPEVQKKAQEEIDRVVGKSRPIGLADKESLPYLEALMWEVQRFNTIVPNGLPHYNKTDMKIGDYDIPAHTMLVPSLHGVHMNRNQFPQPGRFNPQRFIDPSTGKFVKHPHVIPFAIGKRSCLGELLARQELFIFTAALLQSFEFQAPEGMSKIDANGLLSFTYIPKPFNVRAIPR